MKRKKIVEGLLLTLAVIFCIVCLSACGDDTEDNNYPVVGSWRAVAIWRACMYVRQGR